MKLASIPGVAAGVCALTIALLLSSCSSSSSQGDTSATSADPRLPETIRASGVMKVGSAVGFPPYEFYADDGTTVMGYEPDLMHEIGKRLGIRVEFVNDAWASLFPGLKTGRFDAVATGMTVTKERQETNDFVSSAKDSYGILVRKGQGKDFQEQTDLCGKTITGLRGSEVETWGDQLDQACSAAGKPSVNMLVFDSGTQALLAVQSGRAEATSAQVAQLLYYAKQSPADYEVDEEITYSNGFVGFAVSKDNRGLSEAMAQALQQMIDDGTYTKIMHDWNLDSLTVADSVINPVKS